MLLEQFQSYSTAQRPAFAQETLYHKDVGFPKDLDMPRGFNSVMDLKYGGHAKEQALVDKYGAIQLPHRIDLRKGEIFEIGAKGKLVTKLGVRFKYDDTRDIILIVNPADGFVRTVWFNVSGDAHKTLDTSKYTKPTNPMTR